MSSEAVRDALWEIMEERGELDPDVVVARATDEKHPLHSHFEWDDQKCGVAHRREQASSLIRSVRVSFGINEEGMVKSIRAFVVARPEGTPRNIYQPTEKVVMNPVQYAILVSDFKRDWLRFQARWQHLEEFRAVVLAKEEEGNSQTG